MSPDRELPLYSDTGWWCSHLFETRRDEQLRALWNDFEDLWWKVIFDYGQRRRSGESWDDFRERCGDYQQVRSSAFVFGKILKILVDACDTGPLKLTRIDPQPLLWLNSHLGKVPHAARHHPDAQYHEELSRALDTVQRIERALDATPVVSSTSARDDSPDSAVSNVGALEIDIGHTKSDSITRPPPGPTWEIIQVGDGVRVRYSDGEVTFLKAGTVGWALLSILDQQPPDEALEVTRLAKLVDELMVEVEDLPPSSAKLTLDELHGQMQSVHRRGGHIPIYTKTPPEDLINRFQATLRTVKSQRFKEWRAKFLRWDRKHHTVTLSRQV